MNGKFRQRKARSRYSKTELCTTLFDQSREGMFIVDSRLQIMDANPSSVTLLGYPRDEILKLTLPDLISPEEARQINLIKKAEVDNPRAVKCHLRHRNGRRLSLAPEARRLSDGNILLIFNIIPKRQAKQIFGLFNKLNPNSDGTGVGLALVKRIIEFPGAASGSRAKRGRDPRSTSRFPPRSSS